jgi:hypothetical protein
VPSIDILVSFQTRVEIVNFNLKNIISVWGYIFLLAYYGFMIFFLIISLARNLFIWWHFLKASLLLCELILFIPLTFK